MHKHKHRPNLVASKKTFQKEGHWIVNPTPTHVLNCPCGNKYLKTRTGQAKCLRCLSTRQVS